MDLKADLRREGDVVIAEFHGEVDVYTAPVLRDTISKVLAAGYHTIVADLTHVGFLDSTGLGVLVGRLKAVRVLGGQMRVVVTNPRILRNFQITGLDNILPVDASVTDALAALRP